MDKSAEFRLRFVHFISEVDEAVRIFFYFTTSPLTYNKTPIANTTNKLECKEKLMQ